MISIDDLQFGCELEFYVNQMIEEELIEELEQISNKNLILNNKDGQNDDSKMNYKRDASLHGENGKEITTPICSYEKLKEYILKICKLISSNAQTNGDTGFHIHISTIDDSLSVDFYRFMLLSNNESLLSNWGDRNKFSLNVMDILDVLDFEEARKFKNKKGRIWSLEKRNNNHIEIRTIGGAGYEKKAELILSELDKFIEIFLICLQKPDKNYLTILKEHMLKLQNTPKEKRDKFLEIINK